jgi:hypothetical protein
VRTSTSSNLCCHGHFELCASVCTSRARIFYPPITASSIAMDSTSTFADLLDKLHISDQIRTALQDQRFTSPSALFWSLQSEQHREPLFESILASANVTGNNGMSVLASTSAGLLRRLFHECRQICENKTQPAPSLTPFTCTDMEGSKRLSAEDRKIMTSSFSLNYPAEVLDSHNSPSPAFLQLVSQQKKANDLQWVPWKRITNVFQQDQIREKEKPQEKTFLTILSEAAGIDEAIESDNIHSPFHIQRILNLRATAWAMTQFAHLSSGRKLANKFMAMFTKQYPDNSGLRPPSCAEAGAADQEIIKQIASLVSDSISIDQAIHEVVIVRDAHTTLLQARPRSSPSRHNNQNNNQNPPTTLYRSQKHPSNRLTNKRNHFQKSNFDNGKGKGGKGGKGKGKQHSGKSSALCFKYQTGTCGNGSNCRYPHKCDNCGENHPRISCPKLAPSVNRS